MIVYDQLQPRTEMNLEQAAQNTAATTGYYPELLSPSDVGRLGTNRATIAIVGAGPSARTKEALAELNNGRGEDGRALFIILAGTGYNLLHHGLKRADAVVLHNPESKFVAALPTLGDFKIDYLLASSAPAGVDPENPSVFDTISAKGGVIKLWHPHLDGMKSSIGDDKVTIGTGYGATIAALALCSTMGYRRFKIFGMDGNAQANEPQLSVAVNGKPFAVSSEHWPQTQELIDFRLAYPEAIHSLHIVGDNVNAAIFNTPDAMPADDIKVSHSGRGSNVPAHNL